MSVGKVNYCMRTLVEEGWVEVRAVKNKHRKRAYTYLFTRKGVEEKSEVTKRFLESKMAEFEELKVEIDRLMEEIGATNGR